MASLMTAIRDELGTYADLEVLDLYRLAEILQPVFPHIPLSQLALEVAKVAVEGGCRYFIWDPPSPP